MSPTSLLHNLFPWFFDNTPEQTPQEYTSEEGLARRTKYLDSERTRKIKDIGLGTLRWLSFGALALLAWRLAVDPTARTELTNLLIQNIVGIVYALLLIVGIKINSDK